MCIDLCSLKRKLHHQYQFIRATVYVLAKCHRGIRTAPMCIPQSKRVLCEVLRYTFEPYLGAHTQITYSCISKHFQKQTEHIKLIIFLEAHAWFQFISLRCEKINLQTLDLFRQFITVNCILPLFSYSFCQSYITAV